jgi:uncharacterized membrane protein
MTVESMPTPPPERRAERIEDDEHVDALVAQLTRVAEKVLPSGRLLQELRGRSIGHALHPVLTDIPIGCWTSASILDLTGAEKNADAARRLVGTGVLFVAPTALAGLADWVGLRSAESRRVGAVHAMLNVVGGTVFTTSWLLRRTGHVKAGAVVGLLGNLTVVVSGYLGSHLAIRRGEPGASAD